jgi:predicted dehydrogenase
VAADLRIAVLGAGVHGSRYAEHLLRGDVPGARLAGVSRRDPAAGAAWRALGVRWEADAPALAADPAVDACVVATPPVSHLPDAAEVLGRGKPLLLEKPVAPDGAACEALRSAALRAGVPVLVGHSHRYNPVARAFREAIRALGPLRTLSISLRHERMDQEWQRRRPGGGALLSLGVHAADLARWIGGAEIAVAACRTGGPPGEAEAAAALLGSVGGAALQVDVSIDAAARRGALEAAAEGGAVEGEIVAHELSRRAGRERRPIPLPPPGPGLVPLLADFVAAARGGSPGIAATLEDGIAAVTFAEAALRAAGHSPR